MIPQHIFVTGTDTEVGKTRISGALIKKLQQQGYRTAGMKPIASGCEWHEQQWQNEDALALIAQSDVFLPYAVVNPYAFEPAIAPHIAAEQGNVQIDLTVIDAHYQMIKRHSDAVVVEGAGGWLVPINQQQTMADIAKQLALPVVLVVDIKLGCINHALLTVASIEQHGLALAGWVANHRQEQTESRQMIDTLRARIKAPCLGVVPYLSRADMCADSFLN